MVLTDSNIFDIKLEDYLKISTYEKRYMRELKLNCAIQWNKKEVPIDPYVLGYWLGDGDHNGAGITSIDHESIEYIAKWLITIDSELVHHTNGNKKDNYHYGIRKYKSGKLLAIGDAENSSSICPSCIRHKKSNACDLHFDKTSPINSTYGEYIATNGMNRNDMNPFKIILKKNDLFKDKHIPLDYIANDKNTRLQLLAGFIDSDGTVKYNGGIPKIEIVQSSSFGHHKLIDSLQLLCKSLGFSTSVNTYTRTQETGFISKMKSLGIYGDNLDTIPTKIKRKKIIYKTERERSHTHNSIEVKHIGKGKYNGWQLDKNERFLLGNFTITHNSRLLGGKDHSSARYIFTQLSTIIRYIIRKEDNGILSYMDDDGQKIEPKVYYPIIPLVLVNGAEGIGTGFSTFIPNYNINDIIDVVMDKLNGNKGNKLEPFYKDHTGSLKKIDSETFLSKGIIRLEDNKLFITELPLKTWTTKYKVFLEEMIYGGSELFSNYSNQSSDVKVLFILKLKDANKVKEMMNKIGDYGVTELEKHLKLYDTFKTTNMHGFNADTSIKKYSSPNKIIDEYFTVRLDKYSDRKKLLLSQLRTELDLDENKLRWLSMILSNQIDLRKMKHDETISMLDKKKFTKKDSSYDYLLNIPIKDMTKDHMDKLKGKIKNLIESIKKLEKETPISLWKTDLEELKVQLKKINI